MEFAASWKPFMKSNASATSTSTTTTVRLTWERLHASLAGRCKIPFALKAKPADNYECSSTMPSTMFATSSQRSVMSSSSS